MQKLRVKDTVVVLCGKDRGKQGQVKSINLKTNRVVVEGLNVYKKTMRPSQENPQGGIVDMEKPIHRSNVAVVSPKTSKGARIGIKEEKGKKVRFLRNCGSELK